MKRLDRATDCDLGDLAKLAFEVGMRSGRVLPRPIPLADLLAALGVPTPLPEITENEVETRIQVYACYAAGYDLGRMQPALDDAQDGS